MRLALASTLLLLTACKDSPAVDTYREYVKWLAFENYNEAEQYATGAAEAFLATERQRLAGEEGIHRALKNEVSTVGKVEADIVSEEKTERGVEIEAKVKVCRDQAGCAGAGCTSCVVKAHRARVCLEGDMWLVCDSGRLR